VVSAGASNVVYRGERMSDLVAVVARRTKVVSLPEEEQVG
jgi:hypothetical protein